VLGIDELGAGDVLGLEDGLLLGTVVRPKDPVGVGPLLGDVEGVEVVGVELGRLDGEADGLVLGFKVGDPLGREVGPLNGSVLGLANGRLEGDLLGSIDGAELGLDDGSTDGLLLGSEEGPLLGLIDGVLVGLVDGWVLGIEEVGAGWRTGRG
jgi:hypothetical protein